jgi:DNA-binding MarR family transcriptional regulator
MHILGEQNATSLQGPMPDSIDIHEISSCTCLRARRISRQLTRLYDGALQPTGVTANQFTLLVKLLGVSRRGMSGLSMGALAERVGMHYSTLNRDIKPLKRQGFVSDTGSERDGRVRMICITEKGQAKLLEALPAWRKAQMHVQDVLGHEVTLSLNGLLDLACDKVGRHQRVTAG